jgi:hypothetical protein
MVLDVVMVDAGLTLAQPGALVYDPVCFMVINPGAFQRKVNGSAGTRSLVRQFAERILRSPSAVDRQLGGEA